MKTLKTIFMALSLAAVSMTAQAQEAAPVEAAAAPAAFEHRAPDADIGQPLDGGWHIQPQVTELGHEALWLHDWLLMPVITIISLFVLFLLAYVMVRFRAKANPVPSKTAHNTLIEIVWTLVPVLILVVIAVPSIRLLAHQYDQPKADLTVKVVGNQWYWTYEYPDNGDFELISNMLPDDEAKKRGEPRLLGVDERMVVPVNSVVKVIVTANDVIHSWAVPAFWIKMDAVPGRLNETWFKAEREGVYYGQCSELCGARHGYMPIAVEVVSNDRFAEWVRSKGGTMPGEEVASEPTAAPPAAEVPATDPVMPGTVAPASPVTSQPAIAQN